MTTSSTTIDHVLLAEPASGRLLPPAVFTSSAVFDAEQSAVFGRSWVHVADLADVSAPGDFVAAHIGRVPVVVLRGSDGELRAFLNACRHRGATLAVGRGNCGPQLRCPYHAWSYKTDGRLAGVPHRDEFECDLSGMDLIAIRVGTLGPMVMACLDPHAPPLASWAGELDAALDRARGAEMMPAFELEYDVPVNWKVYVENGLEGYHIGFVHDVLADFVERGPGEARHVFGQWSSATFAKISPPYAAMLPPLPHLSVEESTHVRFGHVFPNLIPVLTPTDFSYLRIDPVGPEHVKLRFRSFDHGGVAADFRDFRREAADRTNQQDIAVVQRVQEGLRATGLPAGVHSKHFEVRIGHFERTLVRALARTNGDATGRVSLPQAL